MVINLVQGDFLQIQMPLYAGMSDLATIWGW
jgi:hypothetical protein